MFAQEALALLSAGAAGGTNEQSAALLLTVSNAELEGEPVTPLEAAMTLLDSERIADRLVGMRFLHTFSWCAPIGVQSRSLLELA